MATTDVSHAQPLGRGEVRPEARRSPTTSRARFDGIRRKCFILPMVPCGDIESIDFATALESLETMGLMGGTNVLDGDLSGLLKLPVLRFAGVDKKKHYSHTPAELTKHLESRP